MLREKVYDLIGIGLGPFNLGLAALCNELPGLSCLFLEQNENFNWHPGLLLPGARLQVPFYADLVTLANPCSPFTFLSYLKAQQKMFRFAIREEYFIKRTEYNQYCQWVIAQLHTIRFNQHCTEIYFHPSDNTYEIKTHQARFFTRRIVIGTGTVPHLPPGVKNTRHPLLLHSSEYLFRKPSLLKQPSIAVIGSGQSAAEIFYDLLNSYTGQLHWFTRSDSFYPMDYSKFALEKTSPDYVDYFYALSQDTKREVLSKQDHLYKGINFSLIEAIYNILDDLGSDQIHLYPSCELKDISGSFELSFFHRELQQSFTHTTAAAILATGYRNSIPGFLSPVRHLIEWQGEHYPVNKNYSIDAVHSMFIQNAELHTHGFNAADLGMGPYRNAAILNSILGYEHFQLEKQTTFQKFGLPSVKERPG